MQFWWKPARPASHGCLKVALSGHLWAPYSSLRLPINVLRFAAHGQWRMAIYLLSPLSLSCFVNRYSITPKRGRGEAFQRAREYHFWSVVSPLSRLSLLTLPSLLLSLFLSFSFSPFALILWLAREFLCRCHFKAKDHFWAINCGCILLAADALKWPTSLPFPFSFGFHFASFWKLTFLNGMSLSPSTVNVLPLPPCFLNWYLSAP